MINSPEKSIFCAGVADGAVRAKAALPFPEVKVGFSPEGPEPEGFTMVNSDTRWWVYGLRTTIPGAVTEYAATETTATVMVPVKEIQSVIIR